MTSSSLMERREAAAEAAETEAPAAEEEATEEGSDILSAPRYSIFYLAEWMTHHYTTILLGCTVVFFFFSNSKLIPHNFFFAYVPFTYSDKHCTERNQLWND